VFDWLAIYRISYIPIWYKIDLNLKKKKHARDESWFLIASMRNSTINRCLNVKKRLSCLVVFIACELLNKLEYIIDD